MSGGEPASFALRSRRVVTPQGTQPATVVIAGEQIAAVLPGGDGPAGVSVEDLGELVVLPGLIDAHVHINEPGRAAWEGFATATRAAAAGGVTTLLDMPLNSSPVTTTRAALDVKMVAAAGQLTVDIGLYAGLVPGNLDELPGLLDAGVCGVKAFLCDSGLAEFPAAGEEDLRAALPLLAERNVPLLAHAEVVPPDASSTPPRTADQWLASRPVAYERAAIELLAALQQEFAAPVHVVHLAAGELLPLFAEAKAAGRRLTVETCPHYLWFAVEELAGADPRFKCAPPIRSAEQRRLLWEGVLAGVVDTIGSDHSPCPPAMKHLGGGGGDFGDGDSGDGAAGDWAAAWGGIMGLELTLPLIHTAGKPYGLTYDRLAELLASRPAELFGLTPRKGRLVPGADADLCIWDPAAPLEVDDSQLQQRHPITPYAGCTLEGRVRRTYLRGRLVYDGGQFPDPPGGRVVRRSE